MKRVDLSDCESSAKKLEDAKDKMKDAKNNIKVAKEELNVALGNSIKKIEQEKKAENKIKHDKVKKSSFSSVLKNKGFKGKYETKLAELYQKKSDMKKRLEEFKSDGTDKWDSFKKELNYDLDEIETSVKNFMDYNKKKVKKLVS